MRTFKKYLLFTIPLFFLAGCDGDDTSDPSVSYKFTLGTPVVYSDSAVIGVTYEVDAPSDPTLKAGIMFIQEGGTAYTRVEASEIADHGFTVSLTGLQPATVYMAYAFAETAGGKRHMSSSSRSFTTRNSGEGPSGSYTFTIATGEVTTTSAVIEVGYDVDAESDPTLKAGVMYTRYGGSNYVTVEAPQFADRSFKVTLTGLDPGTSYTVYAFADTSEGRTKSTSNRNFTTKSSGGDPGPVPAGGWAELPVMKEMTNVIYVTHYVSSNGQSMATPTTKGRVRNYTLCYDTQKHQPLWAAYPMHAWYDAGDSGRTNAWKYDPSFASQYQPNLSSKYNGAYHRGHQVASSDRQRSKPMNNQTFYYSNMSPQIQNEFNGGIWNNLEQKVQSWGWACSDTLYVVSGGAFTGTQTSTTDNDGKVIPVPSHYYKVLISSKTGRTGKPISQLKPSEIRCVGFWLDHFGYGTKDKISTKEMKSVAEIENLTGFEFFPMLSEEAKSVKNGYNAGDWGM